MRETTRTILATLLLTAASLPLSTHASEPPLIIAHRAGTADYPENTLLAIRHAIDNRVDGLWLTVQLSADGVPVLYRPLDLSALTQGHGAVSTYTAQQLGRLNAGWNFRDPRPDSSAKPYPYRDRRVPIPTLEQALEKIPARMPVILDLKSLPAQPLVDAVAQAIEKQNRWRQVRFYSTDASFDPLLAAHPRARRFETRDATRERLLTAALSHRCAAPPREPVWAAFELRRRLEIVETFTLGEGHTTVADAMMWTPEAVACFRQDHRGVGILMIGINTEADYLHARRLGASAVLVDSPAAARRWKRLRP